MITASPITKNSTMKVPNDDPPAYTDPANPPDYPPPPGIAHPFSTGANATLADADRALAWCQRYPLTPPARFSAEQLRLIAATQQPLLAGNPNLDGAIRLLGARTNSWLLTARPGCRDALVQAALPSYSALAHRPREGGVARIYFEVSIVRLGSTDLARDDKAAEKPHHHLGGLFHHSHHAHAEPPREAEQSGVALGFVAPPYPPFRLPGWQRGSLAVHSDDGRRYVANENGGVDFAAPFRVGETVGLGVEFRAPPSAHYAAGGGAGPGLAARVIFTREGRVAGGWDLAQDTDAGAERIEGLVGERDLFAAVGVFGALEVEVVLGEEGWRFREWSSSAGKGEFGGWD